MEQGEAKRVTTISSWAHIGRIRLNLRSRRPIGTGVDRHGPGQRRARGEDGASLVEFALILPVFAMLMLGTITGGLAYNRQLALTGAAREGVRYAATLPQPATMARSTWADQVRDVTVQSADGELGTAAPRRYVCVARSANLLAFKREYVGTSAPTESDGSMCFDDGRAATENRVQVVVRRSSVLEAMVFSHDLDLESRGVARYEAPSP